MTSRTDKPTVGSVALVARKLAYYGVTRQWLLDEVEAGRLPACRISGKLRLSVNAVEAALIDRLSRPICKDDA